MDLGNGLGHLTYSTLVHPADDWPQLWNSLNTYLPKVKARFAGNKSFGVCIRLSAKTAETLANSPAEREKLKKFLGDNDMYIYTANAFVYGHFKGDDGQGTGVRAGLAHARSAPSTPSMSPTFWPTSARRESRRRSRPRRSASKPRVTGPDVVASYTNNVLRVVAHLIALEAKTGRTVQLALEPEPFCFLETTDETIDYFTKHLYSGAAVEKLAKLAHVPIAEANEALRRHLGIVYDICHQAVEYEDIAQSLQKLVDAGVPVFKLQEAAALHMPEVTQPVVDTLKRYAKTIYLTQTLEKRNGKINRYLNVDDAIAAFEKDPGPREWRTHIHVPVFLDDLGQFRTTRFAIEDALRFHKQKPLSRHLEVETYTWDMLPDSLKSATSSTISTASLTGCAASWSSDSFPSPLVGEGGEGGREVSFGVDVRAPPHDPHP